MHPITAAALCDEFMKIASSAIGNFVNGNKGTSPDSELGSDKQQDRRRDVATVHGSTSDTETQAPSPEDL